MQDPGDACQRPGAWSDWLEPNMHDDIAAIPQVALDRYADTPTERTGECVLWRGKLDRYGYGYVRDRDGRRHYSSHRLAYLLRYGVVPTGLVLDHLCHTRDCVNAEHLEAVTNAENLRRGRPVHQPDCKRGHPLSGENLRMRPNGARTCRDCSREAVRRYQAKRKAAA